jgi:ribonuclease-3 family protein
MNQFITSMNLEPLDELTVRMMNPLKLAYLGDVVYEMYIRVYLINKVVLTPHEMSKKAIQYVKASSQASLIIGIKEYLTEEEWTLVKRGRNQKSSTVPKNALMSDYRYATGFESLIGYLHLLNREERIIDIIKMGIEYLENKKAESNGSRSETDEKAADDQEK